MHLLGNRDKRLMYASIIIIIIIIIIIEMKFISVAIAH